MAITSWFVGAPLHVELSVLSSVLVLVCSLLLLYVRSAGSKKATDQQLATATASAKARAAATAAAVAAAHDPNKPLVRLLYGTQTGTAERFAKQLGKELTSRYGDSTTVDILDVENYNVEERLPKEKLVVLLMATYGDGEPTDNATAFFAWLLAKGESAESEDSLKGVTYAVFGLGNKQYEHFNKMGKLAHKQMGALGASPLLRRGDGDDDDSIDDDFDKWCAELHTALEGRSDLVGSVAASAAALTPDQVPAYDVRMLPAEAKEEPAFAPGGSGMDPHHPALVYVTRVRELHAPGADRSCVHAEVDVSGSGISYETGDHVALHAANGDALIEQAAALLYQPLDAVFVLSVPPAGIPAAMGLHDPPTTRAVSLRTCLSLFADLCASPRKDELLSLAAFASDPKEAERLRLLASNKDEFATYIGKAQRTLLEVMSDFPSAVPSLGAFLGSIAPRLQPRYYSISSSPSLHPNSIHVTCAVVREPTPTGRTHEGVASSWLARCASGGAAARTPVAAFVRHSHFRLPPSPATPIVMVGPGTGLAPFRGFLQERSALQAKGEPVGPGVLFFGCRKRATDYIYEDELEDYLGSGALSELHVAFSRDGKIKDYVQHHMEREAKTLWPLLEGGAYVYVCGDAKNMAKDVHRALIALVQKGRKCSGTAAEAWVKAMQDGGRYQRDVW